jgi:hypothetical protein
VAGSKVKHQVKNHISKLTKLHKSEAFKQSRFSRANLVVFGIIFASIGGYLIYSSFAATPTTANLWIDTNGGTCTRSATPVAYNDAAACASIKAVETAATSGDNVLIKDGTYPGEEFAGTKTLTFEGAGPGRPAFGQFITNATNVTFKHIAVENRAIAWSGNTCAYWDYTLYVCGINQTYDDVIVDGLLKGKAQGDSNRLGGIEADAANFTFKNGEIKRIRDNKGFQGGGDGMLMENNLIHDVGLTAQGAAADVHLECAAVTGGNNQIWRANQFYDCSVINWVAQNYVDGPVFGPVTLENNTFAHPMQGDVNGSWQQGAPSISLTAGQNNRNAWNNWIVRYNTFESDIIVVQTITGVDDNKSAKWYGNLGADPGCNTPEWTVHHNVGNVCSSATGNVVVANALNNSSATNQSPFYVDAPNHNFHLKAGVTPIDKGDPANYPTTDADGNNRFAGAAPDAGAYEFGAASGAVANLWVDTNGGTCTRNATPAVYSDAAACTWDQANDKCVGGDSAVVKGGTYGDISITGSNGRAGPGVCTFQPASGETVTTGKFENGTWQASGGGGNYITFKGPVKSKTFYADFTSNVTLDGWEVDAGGQAAAINQPFHVESTTGPFTLKNSKIHNSYNGNSLAIFNGNGGPLLVDNNDFYHDINDTGGVIHDECVYTYAVKNMTFTRNHLWGCNVMDLFFTGNTGTNLATNWLIENNVFEAPTGSSGNSTNAILFSGGTRIIKPDGITIRNNTFGSSGISLSEPDSTPTANGMTITGNYFYTQSPCGITNTTYSYNVTPTGVNNCGGTGAQSFSLSSINAGFVNFHGYSGNTGGSQEPSGDYHLTSSSPLINIGNTGSSVGSDKDGNSRPVGAAPDIGAYEFGGSVTPPPAPPPTPPPTPPPPTPPPPTGTLLVGNTVVEGLADGITTGQSEAWPFTAVASGTANSALLYLDSTSSAQGVLVGLYSNSSGAPGSLLATATISSPTSGWNSANFSSPPTITSGTQYWIAVLGTGTGQVVVRDRGSGGTCSARVNATPNNWTNLHNPFGSLDPTLFAQCPVSAYVIATASTGPKTADIDGNSIVDITDLSYLLSSYGQNTTQCVTNAAYKCDLNSPGDGVVNIFDLSILLSNYGK